jgi:anhydro-N-acetylmuramic acid kinase
MVRSGMEEKVRLVIGLMSGTSADGIDAALVRIQGQGTDISVDLEAFNFVSYPDNLRSAILKASEVETSSVEEVCRLNVVVGEWFARSAVALCDQARVSLEAVDFIGSHGQTFHHLPALKEMYGCSTRSSLQLGDPSVIAERTGITTVADFRARDLAAGGQGAPLVPIVDYLLYRSEKVGRVLINIGGIANMTHLPAGCDLDDVIAFDTGPGNMIMDAAVTAITGGALEYDKDGEIGMSGTVFQELRQNLMSNPYLALPPPKSTGRELFGSEAANEVLAWRNRISDEDLVATLTAFTTDSIVDALDRFVHTRGAIDEIIVSGGGTKNPGLMQRLKHRVGGIHIQEIDALGMPSEAKEAVAFAVLANETLSNNQGNVPGATGAKHPAVLGVVAPGRRTSFSVD